VATDAIGPQWSPDGKAIAYTYGPLGKQRTYRLAVRHVGGKERFISRWITDRFTPWDWSAERGLLGTFETRPVGQASLALWPTTNPDADKPDQVLISKPNTDLWQGKWSVAELCRCQL
jgi:hypothetical protein